jgi:hypothetical protein
MKKVLGPWILICCMQGVIAHSAHAQSNKTVSNWRSGVNEVNWKNQGGNLCWRSGHWTPATAAAGCDGALTTVPVACASGVTTNVNRDPKTGKTRVLGATRAKRAASSVSPQASVPVVPAGVGQTDTLRPVPLSSTVGQDQGGFLMSVKSAPTHVPTTAMVVTPENGKNVFKPTGATLTVERILPTDSVVAQKSGAALSPSKGVAVSSVSVGAVVVSNGRVSGVVSNPLQLAKLPQSLPPSTLKDAPTSIASSAPLTPSAEPSVAASLPPVKQSKVMAAGPSVLSNANSNSSPNPSSGTVISTKAALGTQKIDGQLPVIGGTEGSSSRGSVSSPVLSTKQMSQSPIVADPVSYCGDRPFQRYGSSVTCL